MGALSLHIADARITGVMRVDSYIVQLSLEGGEFPVSEVIRKHELELRGIGHDDRACERQRSTSQHRMLSLDGLAPSLHVMTWSGSSCGMERLIARSCVGGGERDSLVESIRCTHTVFSPAAYDRAW